MWLSGSPSKRERTWVVVCNDSSWLTGFGNIKKTKKQEKTLRRKLRICCYHMENYWNNWHLSCIFCLGQKHHYLRCPSSREILMSYLSLLSPWHSIPNLSTQDLHLLTFSSINFFLSILPIQVRLLWSLGWLLSIYSVVSLVIQNLTIMIYIVFQLTF